MSSAVIYETLIPTLNLLNRGKVRDIYDLDESLLVVATDRISAFDVVFSDPIPGKGEVLTQVSRHWFEQTKHIVRNWLITCDIDGMPEQARAHRDQLEARSTLGRKAEPIALECIVRGYLDGSGWKDYQRTGEVCGHKLPEGMKQREPFPEPLFTPSTKAEGGEHDENITGEQARDIVGADVFDFVKEKSIELFKFGHDAMKPKGIILGDTKFEFGRLGDEIILIDECMTPDSSRFWEAETYTPGDHKAFSFDKQFVRDYVESIGWNKKAPAPHLPEDIIQKTTERYKSIAERILS